MGTPWGLTPEERFLRKVEVTPSCWLWLASKSTNGYGMFGVTTGVATTAHRWSYMHFVGPIPDGFQVDHLCRVRHCVNPDHLEAVTPQENIRRQPPRPPGALRTACPKGHLLTEENTYTYLRGGRGLARKCRTCSRALWAREGAKYNATRNAKRRQAVSA